VLRGGGRTGVTATAPQAVTGEDPAAGLIEIA